MLKKIKESFMLQTLYSKWPRVLRPGYISDQKMRNEIKKTEYLSRDELIAYQFKKLNSLLHYAWDECPGYKKLWKEYGFKPAHFKTLKDLQHVPFLTKDYLRDHLESLISSKYKNKKKEYITTVGSKSDFKSRSYRRRKKNMAI